jgi:hypothetical protein
MTGTWSELLHDTSTEAVTNYLEKEGYAVVDTCASPVGEVPEGSVVLADFNGERAIWFLGYLYQRPNEYIIGELGEDEEQGEDEEY